MAATNELQMSAMAADLLIESSPKSKTPQLATIISGVMTPNDDNHDTTTINNQMSNKSIDNDINIINEFVVEDEQKYFTSMNSPSSKNISMNIPSLNLTDANSMSLNNNFKLDENKARASLSHSQSKSQSMTMTSYRRKSFVYRPPTVTSQKDIRTVCFYLAIHGIVIGFVGWSINILISLLYANECQLFHSNGNIQPNAFLYCTLINEKMIEICSNNSNDSKNKHYIISFFIVCCITALLPNLFGTLFGFLWKSKVPDLSALSSRQRKMGNLLMIYRSLKSVNIRKIMAWCMIIFILLSCLVGEYFVDETYFIRYVKGGRWTYCTIVIFTGLFIFKCIQIITDWEFKAYTKQKQKQKRKTDHSDDTDDKMNLNAMLSGVQETEIELMESKKRTALFHRDLTTFMLNTTIGVLLPALKSMPAPWNATNEHVEIYLKILMGCIGEATMFIWSASISSQTIALTIELAMKWIYNKIEKEYISTIDINIDNQNRKDKLILFIYHKIGKKHVHGLYVTHENWFILIVLFLWQCQWGWLNPNMFVMGAGTMLYVTTVYKIRFTFLKPRIQKQFIAHLVRQECFLYMIYLFIPLQFVILLPFMGNIQCNIVVFGIPFISLSITFASSFIYRVCLRKKKDPYLVSITKQWNNIETKLNDRRGTKSIDQTNI
eukprot:512105_1